MKDKKEGYRPLQEIAGRPLREDLARPRRFGIPPALNRRETLCISYAAS